MPVHYPIGFGNFDLDQTATARPATAGPGLRAVHCPVRSANNPVPGQIKETIGLVIHFHGHMGAAVQIGLHPAVVTDRKRHAGLATVNNVKRHCLPAIDQVFGVAKRKRV